VTVARYYTPSGRLIQREYDGKDRTAYAMEALQREEEEGENMEHAAEGKDGPARPAFKTARGRTVYGGGGITPDHVVKYLKTSATTGNLARRDIFYQYVASHLGGPGRDLTARYGGDLAQFVAGYEVGEPMLEEFKAMARAKSVTVDDAEFAADREYIRTRLKATIARTQWGNEGWSAVMLRIDPQFRKAVTVLPDAAGMAKAG